MWVKDRTVYGINITRTCNGDKAVFDRSLSDEKIIDRLIEVVIYSTSSSIALYKQVVEKIIGRMESGKTFAEAAADIYGHYIPEGVSETWTNDHAVARVIADLLTRSTGIRFAVEWSELNDMNDTATGPDGDDLVRSGEMDIEYFVYVEPSMPWDEHYMVYRSEDDVRDMLLTAVRPFVYGHVHWPAEAQIGDLDCWHED